MDRVIVLAALVACGRTDFDPAGDATIDDASSSGLVLHLTFDGTITTDSGPHGHDATCTTCPVKVSGRVGSGAVSFDGTQCLDIADALDLRPITYTAAFWTDVTPVANAFEQAFTHSLNGATTQDDTFEMFYEDATNTFVLNTNFPGPSIPWTPGWHHLAMVYDGGSITSYVDGAPGAPIAVGGDVYSTDAIRIGCDLDDNVEDNNYVGLLDDVRLYDRAISASEIAALAAM